MKGRSVIVWLAAGIIALSCLSAAAQTPRAGNFPLVRELTPDQIDRLRTCQYLLEEVTSTPLDKAVEALQLSGYPEENLLLMEAMAVTFTDIVKQYQIKTRIGKRQLYDRILLNMAYFQLGGFERTHKNESSLDRMIRRKLRSRIPQDLFSHPGLFHSLRP